MATVGKIEQVDINLLVPYEHNAKIHSDFQVQKIANSIKEFGFVNPCLIDKDYNVIAGHGRIEGAKLLGMDKVPCLFVEGLTETQRKAYILADNKLGELAEWDMNLVVEELKDLQIENFDIELTGFDLDDFDMEEPIVKDDGYEEQIPEIAKSKLGQIYQLGKNRVMCGDSTSKEDVEKLMGGYRLIYY